MREINHLRRLIPFIIIILILIPISGLSAPCLLCIRHNPTFSDFSVFAPSAYFAVHFPSRLRAFAVTPSFAFFPAADAGNQPLARNYPPDSAFVPFVCFCGTSLPCFAFLGYFAVNFPIPHSDPGNQPLASKWLVAGPYASSQCNDLTFQPCNAQIDCQRTLFCALR
jgi:hypothetical protein